MEKNKIEFIENLKRRFKDYVVLSTKLYQSLPYSGAAKIFGNQFLRSASSAGANYHAACRARSSKEFYAKMSIVVEEIDESCFWIEMLVETEIVKESSVESLSKEGNELLAIVAKARKNTFK